MTQNTQSSMFSLSKLKEIDPSIHLLKGEMSTISIETISHNEIPKNHSFFFIKSAKYLKLLGSKLNFDIKELDNLGCLIEASCFESLSEDLKERLENSVDWFATVESVDKAMCLLSKPFYDEQIGALNYQVDGRQMGTATIHPEAEISQNVFIGENVTIEAGVKILSGCTILPNVIIKKNSMLYPNVTVYPNSEIGERVRIHAGTAIGSDGFGYNFFDGAHHKIWHIAGVRISNDVEIGANTMVDAGAFKPTLIGDGSKIDNGVQISHNVEIAKHVIVCGLSGIAGSAELSDYVALGAGAGIAPAAKLGVGAQLAARGVISENAVIAPKEVIAGHPGRPLKEWLRSQAVLRKLAKK